MIEAGGFDAHERFTALQRPKILDGDGENFGSPGAGGPSDETFSGNRCIRHGYNVSNYLYCVSLHYRQQAADEETKAFARKTPRQERSRATVEALLEATTDILVREG